MDSPHDAKATVSSVDPCVIDPGERNSQRADHIHIHNVGNPVVRGETLDEEIVIRLKHLRARLAAEVAATEGESSHTCPGQLSTTMARYRAPSAKCKLTGSNTSRLARAPGKLCGCMVVRSCSEGK